MSFSTISNTLSTYLSPVAVAVRDTAQAFGTQVSTGYTDHLSPFIKSVWEQSKAFLSALLVAAATPAGLLMLSLSAAAVSLYNLLESDNKTVKGLSCAVALVALTVFGRTSTQFI